MRWLIYALGGGTGHLMRGLALARQAASRDIAVRILTNSRFASVLLGPNCQRLVPLDNFLAAQRIELVTLPAEADAQAVRAAVQCELATSQFDRLIVDTFPRGLAGELPEILPAVTVPRIFIQRDLSPRYVEWGDLRTVVSNHYDLQIVAGEAGPLADLPRTVHTAPWLVASSDEWLTPAVARRLLDIATDDQRPVAAVLGCGQPAEALAAAQAACELAQGLAERAHVRFLSYDEQALQQAGNIGRCLWPAVAVLPGVDLLIGAGGYHTVHEARATGTPLLAVAQTRLYDRQERRLLPQERANDWQELVARAALQLTRIARPATPPRVTNGAAEALPAIIAATRSRQDSSR